jgi:hypothetical protein
MVSTRTLVVIVTISVIALLALPTATAVSSSGAVTSVNESNYPWLVKGAFANYTTGKLIPGSDPPYFVVANGTILINYPPSKPIRRPLGTGEANMSWIVTKRTGDMVKLYVTFQTSGCQYSEAEFKGDGTCTPYNFSTSLYTEVNVTSGESYTNGEPSGFLNFWGPPLPSDGTTRTAGTVYLDGQPFDSSAVVTDVTTTANSHLIVTWAPPGGISVSGTAFNGPWAFYELVPQSFATGANLTYGWLNVTVGGGSPTGAGGASLFSTASPLGPQGFYDYYNGLAYQFSMPDYPTGQTVCDLEGGKATNCQHTQYSTSLGSYFRSGDGVMNLVATNIQLNSIPPGGSSPGQQPSYLVYVVPAAALVLLGAAVAWGVHRKSQRTLR